MAPSRGRSTRVLFVLVDGLGDVTVPGFGDRTPMEVAHTPVLDAIAAAGLNGLLDSVEPGLACGSDTAHMSIFGYDPRIHYRGRGAFESMGAGIAMAPGDIAFKCNFATVNNQTGIVERRRADRNFEHLGPQLCAALDGRPLPNFPGYKVTVRYATEHRCGVAVSGPGLSDAVKGTDPLKDNLPLLTCEPEDDTPEAAFTAGLVNELSGEFRRVLQGHPINKAREEQGLPPANVVLLRGCGSRIKVPGFQELHGMRGVIVAPTKIIAGLGMSFGMDQREAPGATGSYDSDYASKAATVCGALTEPDGYGFGFVHIKAVDDCGHDRKAEMKVLFMEAVDRMVGQAVRRLWEAESRSASNTSQDGEAPQTRFMVVVTGDHSTPVLFGDHSLEPVPFAVAHVAHVVEALGGPDFISTYPLAPIPMPDVNSPPSLEQLRKQADWVDARRKAAWAGRPWVPFMPAEVFGPWQEPWPQAVRGDPVRSFDELSAARGGLGRFTGDQVMPLIKALANASQNS